MERLGLAKAVDYDIWNIQIRVRMKKLRPKRCAAEKQVREPPRKVRTSDGKTEIRRERSVDLRFLSDVRRETDVRRVRRLNDDGRPILPTRFGKTSKICVFLRPEIEIGSKPFQAGSKSKNVHHESSWKFRGLQLWCFEFFHPRSFTVRKLPKTELLSQTP